MDDNIKIPNHVAIIMDGNGRWAESRGLSRSHGHIAGVDSVRQVIEASSDWGVKFLTIYAFSTENWKRPQDEVDALMSLFCSTIVEQIDGLKTNGIRVRFMGDFSRLNPSVRHSIDLCESATACNSKLTLVIAINYSARWELTMAVRKIAEETKENLVVPNKIDEEYIVSKLFLNDLPDPDLIIRTSGECRLSNFMLWQAAYSELYFTDTLWPDFDKNEFKKAIEAYSSRVRKFGAL